MDADVDAIVAEFYENMFGPAASATSQYGQLFEDAIEGVPKDAHGDFDGAYLASITPDFIAKAGKLLDAADNALAGADVPKSRRRAIAARLRRYRYGLRITDLQALEKRDRLARRMDRVADRLNALVTIIDEIDTDPELAGMIGTHLARYFAETELMRLPDFHKMWEQAITSPDRRAQLLTKLDEGCAREVARELGYLSDWHIVGLWPYDEGDLLDTSYPPEDEVDLDATYAVNNGETGWQFHQAENAYGVVDLAKSFYPEDTEYAVAYAYTTVSSRSDADVRLDVTCDDDIVVWVNDELVFAGGAITGNFDIHVDARLREGENTILVKALNKPHAFEFSIRIVDEDGRPHASV